MKLYTKRLKAAVVCLAVVCSFGFGVAQAIDTSGYIIGSGKGVCVYKPGCLYGAYSRHGSCCPAD